MILFVTGTDTGVGKTVFASQLAMRFRGDGVSVAALKPVSSGGRGDARILRKATGGVLTLDEINPWYYRAGIAPLLAARKEKKKLRLVQVVRHVLTVARRFELVIVEGAGGLLSPLGENFDSRDLILALKATPIVVAPNRLGIVNQVLLTLAALPRPVAGRTHVMLVDTPRRDAASGTNADLLREKIGFDNVHSVPWNRRLN